jgi:hypothetical protein
MAWAEASLHAEFMPSVAHNAAAKKSVLFKLQLQLSKEELHR